MAGGRCKITLKKHPNNLPPLGGGGVADSDETEVEKEFRDELQSQVSQLMDGALL